MTFVFNGQAFGTQTTPTKVDEARINPLKIVRWPSQVLFERAEEVEDLGDPSIQQFVADLLDLCERENLYGLAAPQVGVSLRVFVIDPVRCGVDASNPRVFINPYIEVADGTQEIAREGCASAPSIAPSVPRHRAVRVYAHDLVDTRPFFIDVAGTFGRAIQHELAHLDGKMVTEHATKSEMQTLRKSLKKLR